MKNILKYCLIIMLLASLGITGCQDKIQGPSYAITGYITPDTAFPNYVLKNQWLCIITTVGPVQRPNVTNSSGATPHWVKTDSTGYFSFIYKDPDYWETTEQQRDVINRIRLQMVEKPGIFSLDSYSYIPNGCNFINQRFYPDQTGWDTLTKVCNSNFE